MSLRDLVPWKGGRTSSLAKRGNGDPFLALRDEMNRLFENFDTGFALDTATADWSPKLNVTENDKAVLVSAELPGMEEKDIEVTLHNGLLTIRGEKKQEHEEKDANFYRSERTYGSFERSLTLPCDVEEGKVEARYNKGVLNLTLPKTKEAVSSVKKIPVKAS
jgi:HSP20 family protein